MDEPLGGARGALGEVAQVGLVVTVLVSEVVTLDVAFGERVAAEDAVLRGKRICNACNVCNGALCDWGGCGPCWRQDGHVALLAETRAAAAMTDATTAAAATAAAPRLVMARTWRDEFEIWTSHWMLARVTLMLG